MALNSYFKHVDVILIFLKLLASAFYKIHIVKENKKLNYHIILNLFVPNVVSFRYCQRIHQMEKTIASIAIFWISKSSRPPYKWKHQEHLWKLAYIYIHSSINRPKRY